MVTMKTIKKRKGYAAGGVLDENRIVQQPVVPSEQVSKFTASVTPSVTTLPADTGLAPTTPTGLRGGATAIQSPESFSQTSGLIGGPRNVTTLGANSGTELPGGLPGPQPAAQQQLAQRGSFVDYMGGRLGADTETSSLQMAAREDANKRIKNILSGPYRYDRAGNRKYAGGNPYASDLISAATQPVYSPTQPEKLRRRKPIWQDTSSYADGTGSIAPDKNKGAAQDSAESVLRKMANKYGVGNSAPMRQPVVRPNPEPKPEPEPERRGLRTAARWREGGDYPIDVKYAAGGIVRGKGGPTDDAVPMSVGGTDVNLSAREAVLPVKTVMAMGGPAAVEDLIERTNGKPPVRSGLRAGGSYATGAGGVEIPDDYMRGRQPPPAQPTVPPLTPEQEMLKRAAASRAADAQARAAQEASQAARSAEAGMRTPGGAAQAAPSRMSNLRAALNPADATKIEDIPRMIKEGGAKLIGSKAGSAVAEVAKRASSAGPALAGLEGAVRGINTTDAEYAQRLGVDEPTTRLGSIAVRAPGVLSDVGASFINAAALPYNAVRHGLNFDKYYDYRDNFDDVASARAQAAAAPIVAAKSAATAGQPQAPTTAMPVDQPQAPTTATSAADIQARSVAAEGLRRDAQREMGLPPTQQQDVVNGGSLVQRGNAGLRAIATKPDVRDALNAANEQQGTGVTYSTVKGADGKPQVMISGGPATKAQYLAADGTPTNDWTQTAQYAEQISQNARNKQSLRNMEMENAKSDMNSALPFYQNRGLRTMAMRMQEDEAAQKGQLTPAQREQLAVQREGLGLQRDALKATVDNREADNARAAAAAQAGESETHRKATDDLIKSWATEDGKLNDQKYAFLQKYASQFERPKGMSSAEHLSNLMDQFAIDTMGDTEGRHWFSSEGTWNGERTKWQKRAATDNLRRGAPLQSIEYHDPLTGRTIYQSDVNKLSPKQRKLFEARVYQ